MKTPPWHRVHPHTVYAQIANTLLQPNTSHNTPPTTLGNITLRDHQLDAVTRITQAIAKHSGALLADSVGLGKTFVALAVARHYLHTHILAPATLRPMWLQAIRECTSNNITLHSLQSLSRRPLPPCGHHTRCLVIIDEAHHLRTRNTIRYKNAANFVADQHVLLLSATPIHNRPHDLHNLLALFLGNRPDALDENSLAQFVIRRTIADTTSNERAALIPSIREHRPFKVPENHATLGLILALPPPLPTQDGAAAGALIRLGLLHAWCSSDAALSDTLRRRQLRGEALLHSLSNGRHPTKRELQSWILGNTSIQLGFPELLVTNTTANTAASITKLSTHLHALNTLLQLHTHSAHADPERAAQLRLLLNPTHLATQTSSLPASAPIIAFSHFASTVHALHRALRDIAGVASLTSLGGHIASGRIARQQLIAAFAPIANGRPPPPPHQQIRLLLTTDLLAEGVNLQDAGTLVHLDLPWTDAARTQRVGRLARMGSPHAWIDVFTFAPPPGIDATLKLVATLTRKANTATTLIGGSSRMSTQSTPMHLQPQHDSTTHPHVETTFETSPEIASRLYNTLKHWSRLHRTDDERAATFASRTPEEIAVATVHSTTNGWIAVVSIGDTMRVVARYNDRTSADSAQLMQAIDTIADVGDDVATTENSTLAAALLDVELWHATQQVAVASGPPRSNIAAAQRQALRAISRCVASVAAPMRGVFAEAAAQAEAIVLRSRGPSAEVGLNEWCHVAAQQQPLQWLRSITEFRSLNLSRVEGLASPPDSASFRVRGLLLLTAVNFSP